MPGVKELDVRSGAAAIAWRSDPCAVLYQLAAAHPGAPIRLLLGDETILVVQDAEAIRHIAHTNAGNYRKHFAGFLQFFGRSRLTTSDEQWRASRDLSQPSITATRRERVAEAAAKFFEAAKTAMLDAAKRGEGSVDHYLDDAAGRVIAETTLGFSPSELSSDLSQDFRTLLQHASLTTWNVPGAVPLTSSEQLAKATEARERLRASLEGLVSRRRSEGDLPPLLATLTEAAGGDLDVFAEVCTLLFAGFDTSSAAAGWAMWLLGGAPALQDALREEIATCYDGGQLDFDRVLGLDSLTSFISEALRIFPPVPILARVAKAADEVSGVAVPAGQTVLMSIIGLHHDRRFHPEPRRVALDRFPGGAMPPGMHGHFLPFGDGERSCPGARIARAELCVGLAVLIRGLKIERPESAPLSFEWLASLRRHGGQQLRLAAV